MRRKSLGKAKLLITAESEGKGDPIYTTSVYDFRTRNEWTQEQINERGINWFLDLDDMKQSLNWNLNGDSSKYQFKWVKSVQNRHTCVAYVFD